MKTKIASVVGALAFMFVAGVSAQEAPGKIDWREQYAYSLGVQAYIFGFPYVYLPSLRADGSPDPRPPTSCRSMRPSIISAMCERWQMLPIGAAVHPTKTRFIRQLGSTSARSR